MANGIAQRMAQPSYTVVKLLSIVAMPFFPQGPWASGPSLGSGGI